MDLKTEAAIVEAMERLMRGRTTFVIAHRPSTLIHCDRILRIEYGSVAVDQADISNAQPDRRAFRGAAETGQGNKTHV